MGPIKFVCYKTELVTTTSVTTEFESSHRKSLKNAMVMIIPARINTQVLTTNKPETREAISRARLRVFGAQYYKLEGPYLGA